MTSDYQTAPIRRFDFQRKEWMIGLASLEYRVPPVNDVKFQELRSGDWFWFWFCNEDTFFFRFVSRGSSQRIQDSGIPRRKEQKKEVKKIGPRKRIEDQKQEVGWPVFSFFSLCTASSNVFLREAKEKSMVFCLLSIEHKARWKGEEKADSNLDGLFLSISISFRRSTLRALSISNFHF